MNYEELKIKNKNGNKSSKKYIVFDEVKNKKTFEEMQKIQMRYKNANEIFQKIFEKEFFENAIKALGGQ